ncbi:signal peptidase I [Cellulomonas sp. ICMP 17802]|uniref:signal peptidase I n=1 Tax=Cellulomonas sp. ICMP 17802 TaxID=3239199 RepID=UPI00351B5F0A
MTTISDESAPAPADERLGLRRAVLDVVSGAALATVVLLALVMIVVPLAMRATPFTVLTGSMNPTMPPGTLVVTRPVSTDDIAIGDVVTYQIHSNQPEVVTHRVVGIGFRSDGERQFLTRGDANNAIDPAVRAVQVRGVVAYHVPYLGYLNTWVGINRPGWLLKSVAAALILYGLVLVGTGARDRLRRRRIGETEGSDVVVETAAAPVALPTVAIERVADRSEVRVAPGAVAVAVVLVGLAVGVVLASRRSR